MTDEAEFDLSILDPSAIALDPTVQEEMKQQVQEEVKDKLDVVAADLEPAEKEAIAEVAAEAAVAAVAEATAGSVASAVLTEAEPERKSDAAAAQPIRSDMTTEQWIVRCMKDAEIETEPLRGSDEAKSFTDEQRVFKIDLAETPEDVLRFNGGLKWHEAIIDKNNEIENDEEQYNAYYLPWPEKRTVFGSNISEFTLVFSAGGTRLADTLRPNEYDISGKSRGLVMTIPFKKLRSHVPGMAGARRGDSYHLVPIKAQLLDYSTEQLPFISCISVCSYGHHKTKGTMMLERYNTDTRKILTASGETHGLTVVPKEHASRTVDTGLLATTEKAKRGILCEANTDLLFSPWISRLGFVDLQAVLRGVLAMTSPVRDIVLIPAPTPNNKGITLANWFVLTFFPFFQVSMNRWYARASQENKQLLGDRMVQDRDGQERLSDGARRVLHAVRTSPGKFKPYLKVPVAAFVELIAFLQTLFHPVRWAMRFTRDLAVKFENQNTPEQNAALLAPIERAEAVVKRRREYVAWLKSVDTGGLEFKKELHRAQTDLEEAEKHWDHVNPLLTEEYAKIKMAAIPVREIVREKERVESMPRPMVDFMAAVDGRGCLCHQKKEEE